MSDNNLIYVFETTVISQETLDALMSVLEFDDWVFAFDDPNVIIGKKQLMWLLEQPDKIVKIRFVVNGDVREFEGTIRPTESERWERDDRKGFWFTKVPSSKG